ncbi:unnamed protein product, partial [Iphiclides podalirius]
MCLHSKHWLRKERQSRMAVAARSLVLKGDRIRFRVALERAKAPNDSAHTSTSHVVYSYIHSTAHVPRIRYLPPNFNPEDHRCFYCMSA